MSKFSLNLKKVGCLVVTIIVVCIIIITCRFCSNASDKKQKEKENAVSQGCITIDSLNGLEYTYLYERNLPCLVYLNSIKIEDICFTIDEDNDELGLPRWIGGASTRTNSGWIKVKNTYFHNYIGFDTCQEEWVLRKAKEYKTIHEPIIIEVYQVRRYPNGGISYKADLVRFLDQEVCTENKADTVMSEDDSIREIVHSLNGDVY